MNIVSPSNVYIEVLEPSVSVFRDGALKDVWVYMSSQSWDPHDEIQFRQFSRSVVSDSATPWTTALQASLSITNSRSLPKPMSIELVMPSNYLILSSSSPPALNLCQHQGLFKGARSSHQVAKVLELDTRKQSLFQCAQWRDHVSKQQEGSHRKPGRVFTRHISQLAHWFWTLQASEMWDINRCCLSLPVCGILLWQLSHFHKKVTCLPTGLPLFHLTLPLNGTHLDVHVLPQG